MGWGVGASPRREKVDPVTVDSLAHTPHLDSRARVIHPIGSVRPVNWVYDRAPMTVYWEMTIACALACRHCRATAWNRPAPGELTTEESVALLDEVARFGDPLPHMIMSGGDPLRRPDVFELLEEARELLPKRDLNALRTVGYTELFQHFDGSLTLAEAVDAIKQHTRNYAKRQLTWLRRDASWAYVPPEPERVIAHVHANR